jgi:hypothetical protein
VISFVMSVRSQSGLTDEPLAHHTLTDRVRHNAAIIEFVYWLADRVVGVRAGPIEVRAWFTRDEDELPRVTSWHDDRIGGFGRRPRIQAMHYKRTGEPIPQVDMDLSACAHANHRSWSL